jgi:HEAT repeat protein
VAVYKVGKDDESLVPNLAKLLKQDDVQMRFMAITVLVELSESSDAAIKALGKALRDKDLRLRQLAAKGLFDRGAEAVPVLVKALKAAEPTTKLIAIRILGEMGPTASEAAPALQALSQDPSQEVRQLAKKALAAVKQ